MCVCVCACKVPARIKLRGNTIRYELRGRPRPEDVRTAAAEECVLVGGA